jgi:hypothetical protein
MPTAQRKKIWEVVPSLLIPFKQTLVGHFFGREYVDIIVIVF